MTGFGRAELNLPRARLVIEVASVNQKNLQISVYGPTEWPGLEALATPWIRARLQRGKVTARVTTMVDAGRPARIWDAEATQLAVHELEELARQLGLPPQPLSLELVLRLAESRRGTGVVLPALESIEAEVRAAFTSALDGLLAMRAQEGNALATDLLRRLNLLAQYVEGMAPAELGAPERRREALGRRLKEAGLAYDLADERVLKELALFADRADITEEIVRLHSHLAQFKAELRVPNSGRKLDFLVQELLREINTVGSKASEIATTKLVLEAKTELERIREQVQNLE